MALKNHTIDSSKVAEEQVESIIDGKIKYDTNSSSVVLLPTARSLANDKKILIYLASLRGWPFLVKENTPPEDASPSEITKSTGIPGGSVRPILRFLKDSGIISAQSGRYSVPSHSLTKIFSLITSNDKLSSRATKKTSLDSKKSKISKPKTNNKPGLAESFSSLVEKKWFAEGKTTSQLKDKLDEMTIFPKMSHLPVHLLKAYRDNILSRKKETYEGKEVWVYYQ